MASPFMVAEWGYGVSSLIRPFYKSAEWVLQDVGEELNKAP